ncbi:MAG TPA: cell division FtsA domain-containing protein [Kurthia sp.]
MSIRYLFALYFYQLVDIGAGTSDIAITDQSTVTAYGMVPTAGDEITEALSDHYLLDFPVAESLKRELSIQSEVTISDILGFDEQVAVTEVIQNIEPAIDHLATTIAREILKLNGQKSPKAVILIGGGSLTPQINTKLSQSLALPDNRVAVRDIDAINNLTRAEHVKATPELVTPIGIAISAKNMPIKYMAVQVNNQVVRMFELKEMTVTDALLSANINASKLYGKPGLAMSVTLNGQTIHIPGELGSPTMIKINGEVATMKSSIKNGDVIELIEGKNGENASATASDLIDNATTQVILVNGQPYSITAKLKINGSTAAFSQQLHEGDEILVETTSTLQQLMMKLGKTSLLDDRSIPTYYLNEQKVNVPQFAATITVNGMACSFDTILQDGDSVDYSQAIEKTLENFIKVHSIQMNDRCDVTFQDEPIQLTRTAFKTLVNHREADLATSLSMNDKIQLLPLEVAPWTFQDVFKFTNWQLPEGFKGTFELVRNNVKAQFDQPIYNGDVLSLRLLPSSTQI